MIDVDHQISAVRRTVGNRTLNAGEARVVTISQTYDADAADLWDACTNINRFRGGSCRSPVICAPAANTNWTAMRTGRS